MKKLLSIILTSALICTMFSGCGMSEEAKSVQLIIDSLPEECADITEEQLNEAEYAYKQLSDKDKKDIDKTKLDNAHSYYIDSVQSIINAIPDEFADVTMEQLNEAKEAYEQLSDENKAYIDTTKIDNYYTELINEINTEIDELKVPDVKNISQSDFNTSYNNISSIMTKIERLTEEYDKNINYDVLKKTISTLHDDIVKLAVEYGNDLSAFQTILSNIESLNSLKSGSRNFSSTAYSYCTDISTNMSAVKITPVTSEFEDALDAVKDAVLHDEDMVVFKMPALAREFSTWSGNLTSYYKSHEFLFDDKRMNKLKEYYSEIEKRQKS